MSGSSNGPQARGLGQPFGVSLNVPQYTFNGYVNSYFAGEIVSFLTFGNMPAVGLVMSPMVAKAYAEALLQSVTDYETASGVKVPSLQEVLEAVQKYKEANQS